MKTNARVNVTTRRSRRHVLMAAGTVVLLGLATAGFLRYRESVDKPGTPVASQGHLHIATAETPHEPYNTEPPTSGPHLSYIAPWGVHTRPIPRELQVHNLEDGGVMVQYSCDCPDVVRQLETIVRRYDKFVVLAPYPAMKSRIALTAWTRIDTMDVLDEKRITRFIEAWRGVDHHPAR